MKRQYLYFLILFSGLFIFNSCGKQGAEGPAGPAGATGSTGATGAVGPAGANGSIIYSGAIVPAGTLGVTGDFYIDLTTGTLFGPKTASGWGTGTSLIGPAGATGATGPAGATGATGPAGATGATGATGAAGSKIYSGTTVPSSSLGANGDFYLDKTNYLLYGPKTASGWGSPINLQGPAGPVGPQGPEGNANVKVDTFSVGGSQWIWNSQYVYETSAGSYTEYFTRYYTRLNNTITQGLLDTGMVLVYFQPSPVNNPDQWAPLPYQFDSSFGYTYNYVYVTAVGQVTLHYFFIQTDPSATLPTLSTYNDEVRKFKVITVTGQTGTFMLAHHINLNNYNEVSRATGIWQQDKPVR